MTTTKSELPQVFVHLDYKRLYDDYGSAEPVTFIKDVPTIKALEFIVERQNKVMYSFSDSEKQRELLYEMRCYMSDKERCEIDSFLKCNDYPCLMDNQTGFLFYLLALQSGNSEDRRLTREDVRNIYKAYLYCSQSWTDAQMTNIGKTPSLEELSIRMDLPIIEFKFDKDFRPQIYKGMLFWAFCDKNPLFNGLAMAFFRKKNVPNGREYMDRLWLLYQSFLDSMYVHIPSEHSSLSPFFDQYAVDLAECANIWDNRDMKYLRNHFLYKTGVNAYLLLNINFLVDKFYQGLIFDFWDAIKEDERNGSRKFNGFGDFKSIWGSEFSEAVLFYNVLDKTFPSYAIKIPGRMMKDSGIEGEPDYYIRQGNAVFIFEFKDSLLADDVKTSTDTSKIKQEVSKKICKDDGDDRKGGGQLLYNINRIISEGLLNMFDNFLVIETIVYPILVVNDASFSAMGVNVDFTQEFCNLGKEKYTNLRAHVTPPVIVELDTLILLMPRLHDGHLKLNDIINDYLSVCNNPICSNMSFSAFVLDFYPIKSYTEGEIEYMYDMLGDKK